MARFYSTIDVTVLENSIREHLNSVANRVMAVLNPLKVVLTNYPVDEVEMLEAINNPEDASAGTRQVPFTRELYIDVMTLWRKPPRNSSALSPVVKSVYAMATSYQL